MGVVAVIATKFVVKTNSLLLLSFFYPILFNLFLHPFPASLVLRCFKLNL